MSLFLQKIYTKQSLSIFLLLFINFLFSYKYISRLTEFSLLISVILTVFYFILLSNSIKIKSTKLLKMLTYSLLVIFISFAIFAFTKIDVHNLHVDRWSVITSFWDATFNNEYPYLAKSHMGSKPGPMPIYFLLTLPFYLINELGYFSLIAVPILLVLFRKTNANLNYTLLLTCFILTSTSYAWEVSSRSNLLTNTLLILWLLTSFIHSKNKKNLYLYAIIAGLLLSTRAVFIIPFIIFLIFSLRMKEITFSNFIVCSFIALLTFLGTFLPLIIFYPDSFFEMNPFIVQSTFLIPSYYTFGFILLAFVLSFATKTKTDVYFFSGLSLFLPILIYMLYHFITNGFDTYYSGKADISYFIFSIPFFIIHLSCLHTNKLEK